MSTVHVEVSGIVPARPEMVYTILADYRIGHPAILPRPYFTSLILQEGGKGAGTVIKVQMDIMGSKRTYQMIVSEPEPGRVLVETDANAGVITTFTVEPEGNGEQARVTIATDTQVGSTLDRWFTPIALRRIYQRELAMLADYVRSGS
ncbi:MAG TPA: SRPBCC family protein [Aggregatilinea sp.]|jgi:hypothetical protein|uniref:SRPBCC family protein n=1 Tax=Aggregatilinea sp. TaxID=2806333 RepID=UPI002D08D36C|nr:SRPBCC family protein [Aggregatilinea sp.]HML20627.1 SRPBCC family protein [Aggregatilinea sp.]